MTDLTADLTARPDLQARVWGLAATVAEQRTYDLTTLLLDLDREELILVVCGALTMGVGLMLPDPPHDTPEIRAQIADVLRGQALIPLAKAAEE